jgi:hypothetical protein
MIQKSLVLFSFDLFRVHPEQHDAACHRYERVLRDSGDFNDLDFAERSRKLQALAAKKYPWKAQRCGRVDVALEGQRFIATLYLAKDLRPDIQRVAPPLNPIDQLHVGDLSDDLKGLREALQSVTDWADKRLAATIYQDTATYETLIERFDLKAFRADYLPLAQSKPGVDRSRHWN